MSFRVLFETKSGPAAALFAAAVEPGFIQTSEREMGRRPATLLRGHHLRERTANARLFQLELSRLFQFSLPLSKLKFQADEESFSFRFPKAGWLPATGADPVSRYEPLNLLPHGRKGQDDESWHAHVLTPVRGSVGDSGLLPVVLFPERLFNQPSFCRKMVTT